MFLVYFKGYFKNKCVPLRVKGKPTFSDVNPTTSSRLSDIASLDSVEQIVL